VKQRLALQSNEPINGDVAKPITYREALRLAWEAV